MTRARWSRTLAFASLLELGSFMGSLAGTKPLNAIVWAFLFFMLSAFLARPEVSR